VIERLTKRLAGAPLGGVAVALIVMLTLWRTNMNRLGAEHALPTIAMVLALAVAVTVVLRLLLGGWARAGIAAAIVAAYLLYAPALAKIAGSGWVVAAIVAVFGVVAILLARRIPAEAEARAVNGKLNLLLLPIAALYMVSAAHAQWTYESARPVVSEQFDSFAGRANGNSPDVWHLLFDRYASASTLRTRYAFDNEPFLAALRSRGFTVADNSYSNYQRTGHSVASTLNGAELDRLAASMAERQDDWVPIYRSMAENRATDFFSRNGYRTVFAGSWWSPTRAHPSAENINYRALPELARVVLDQSVAGMVLQGLRLPYGDGRGEQCRRASFKFDRLEALAADPTRKHVFGHFLVPHPPFVLNADGSCRSLEQAKSASRRDNYVAQVEYANRRLIRLVDVGPKLAPQPFAQERLGRLPHVDVGIEPGRDAFLHHHRLLEQQQVRLRRHVEVAGDREQAVEHLADGDLLDRQAADRLADGAQRGRELLDIVVRRHILRLEMDFGDAAVIAGDEAVEDLRQPQPRLRSTRPMMPKSIAASRRRAARTDCPGGDRRGRSRRPPPGAGRRAPGRGELP
jgi:hypothetical protein